MHKIKLFLITTLMLAPLGLALGGGSVAAATSSVKTEISNGVTAAGGSSTTDPTTSLNTTIANVVNILSVITGLVAVVMIIVSGFRFITASGDATAVGNARKTIIYAIIGVIIVLFAQVIIKFVIGKTAP